MKIDELVRKSIAALFLITVSVLFLFSCSTSKSQVATPVAQLNEAKSGILPDHGGRLSAVVISLNSARRAALRNVQLVSNLVNNLPTDTHVDIFVNDLKAFKVANNPWPERVNFIELPFSNSITIWPQDPFLVLKGEDKTVLLAPKDFDRAQDNIMPGKLAERYGYELRLSELFFEGGNIVSDGAFVFIGENTIRRNASSSGFDEIDSVLQFQKELGRQVLVIGPYPQPVAHIDMILTPLGNKKLAIADSFEGARLAEEELEESPAVVHNFERSCQKQFFGHPLIKTVLGGDGEEKSAPDLSGKTVEMIEKSKLIAPILDGIADSMRNFGYEIVRIPFLFGGPESRGDTDDSEIVASYPMLSYNNVLLEDLEDGKMAYIPKYGWDKIDGAAKTAWENAGYKTQAIDGLTVSAMYGGALRCSVKVLRRIDSDDKEN